MSEEKKDFVVKDRRFSSTETEAEEDKASAPDAAPETGTAPDPAPEREHAAESIADASEPRLPEINFSTFIFSLNSSVLVHLGLLEDPATGAKQKNLPIAKQTIDILGMLEEKTKGNLTFDEENMLKNILYDLRMLYVREKK